MSDESSISLPTLTEVIQKPLRRIARVSKRYELAGALLTAAAAIGILVEVVVEAKVSVPEWIHDTLVAVILFAGILGALLCVGSVLLRSHLYHHHAAKFELQADLVRMRADLEAGCRQFVEGIDTEAIGRLAGQMQQIELDRQILLQRINAIEKQRQADFDLAREGARKAIDAMHERLDQLAAEVPRLIAEAVAQARAEDRAALGEAMEEAVKCAIAKGYVLGVGERLNGHGTGAVLPFQKP